jgi:cytochrome c
VTLSSAGTTDLDGDSLRYEWTITRGNGTVLAKLTEPNPSFTFARPGVYTASLAVTDPQGARSDAQLKIAAGNEPPTVDVDLLGSNRTFFFPGVPIRYAVRVNDREDGSLANGRIAPQRVVVTAQYLKEGYSPAQPAPEGHRAAEAPAAPVSHAAGKRLIEGGDCLACHQLYGKSIGPAYSAVAQKYHGAAGATGRLVKKIRGGGTGVWGSVMMPGHPQLSEAEASEMVAYILSLADKKKTSPSLPTRGAYTPPVARDSAAQGAVVLRAAYTDRGANGLPGASAEKLIVLRAPSVAVASGELAEGIQKQKVAELPVEVTIVNRSGAFAKLEQVDLTGVSAVTFLATAPEQYKAVGGTVEVRLDSATGPLLGQTEEIRPMPGEGKPAQFRAALTPTAAGARAAGGHDVYFVFRNEQAKGEQLLFAVLTATFESGAARTARSSR